MFEISFYNEKVKTDLQNLPVEICKRAYKLIARMEEYGPHLGMPHSRYMGDGLFEIRAKSAEGIGRVFYCVIIENEIMILHVIVKKSQKTPQNEFDVAVRRMKEAKNGKK